MLLHPAQPFRSHLARTLTAGLCAVAMSSALHAQDLTVSAAASLINAFQAIGQALRIGVLTA